VKGWNLHIIIIIIIIINGFNFWNMFRYIIFSSPWNNYKLFWGLFLYYCRLVTPYSCWLMCSYVFPSWCRVVVFWLLQWLRSKGRALTTVLSPHILHVIYRVCDWVSGWVTGCFHGYQVSMIRLELRLWLINTRLSVRLPLQYRTGYCHPTTGWEFSSLIETKETEVSYKIYMRHMYQTY